jgi:hypothetical protein
MTKQGLAQKRNYFKFVLSGMIKPVDITVLTPYEIGRFNTIKEAIKDLIDNFDNNSRLNGLNVPEHKCWCGKEAKYTKDYVGKGENATWVCKKHLKN